MTLVRASCEWGEITSGAAVTYRLGDHRYRIDAPPATDALSGTEPLLAGVEGGRRWAGRAEQDGVAVLSERCETDGALTAVRVGLINRSDQDLQLEQLLPVLIGPGDLSLGDVPASEWVLVRQPRMKNDLPACVRLGSTGEEVWDAARGTPETGGVPRPADPDAPPPTTFVCSELAVLGTAAEAGERGALALGFVPVTDYLTRIEVTVTDDRRALQSLRMACEGDRQVIGPGAQAWSPWAVVTFAETMEEAVARYTAILVANSPLRATAAERAPSVWCSWYYYGDGFTQEELGANLDWLATHPLPVDVLQIDECWDLRWGEWVPNARWPDLAGAAARIRALGYRPGIWTCGFLAEPRAHVRYHRPHWLLRDRQGEPVRFRMNRMENYVLDPTHPEVQAFLEGTYRRLTEAGYTYHKIDFTRAVAHPEAVFHDRTANRAGAYRQGLAAIRRGIGEEAYLNICGGLYGPALGIADAQRTGSDTLGTWPAHPDGDRAKPFGPFTIKQNTLRFWMNELWHNDPDAAMIRRRAVPYRDEKLSIGTMSDVEAETTVLNQYLTGGIVCFTENLAEIGSDRLLRYRRCIPSTGSAAVPRDLRAGGRFPAIFDSTVRPRAPQLEPWHTVSVVNWHGLPRSFRFRLDQVVPQAYLERAEQFVVSAYFGGWHRLVAAGKEVAIEDVPAHGCEVIKVQPYRAGAAHLLRTDGHFSMGGAEVTGWQEESQELRIRGQWAWPCALELEVLLPGEGETARLRVEGRGWGRKDFELRVCYTG